MFERIRKLFKKTPPQTNYYDAAGLRSVTIRYDRKGNSTFDIDFEFLNIDGEVVSRSTFSEDSYYNKARQIKLGEYAHMLAGSIRMEARTAVEKQLNAILFTNKSTQEDKEISVKDPSAVLLGASGGGEYSATTTKEPMQIVIEKPKKKKARRKVTLISKVLQINKTDSGNIYIFPTNEPGKIIRLQESFFHDVKLAEVYRLIVKFCKKEKIGFIPSRRQVHRLFLANNFKVVKKDKNLMVEDVAFV